MKVSFDLLHNKKRESIRTAEINLKLSEFEFPPMQDVLLIGRRAPIGSESARKMSDALSPDQYEIISLEHQFFEAVIIRKSLLTIIPREKLLQIVLEEGAKVSPENLVLKVHVNVVINVNKVVDLD